MINRIKIKDFKSVRDVDLALDPITVLIGRSGTGKSNIVHAIRFLRNVLLNPQRAVEYEGGWQRILPVGEKKAKPTIEVNFTVPGEEREYAYRMEFGPHPGQHTGMLKQERLLIGPEVVFSRTHTEGHRSGWAWDKPPTVAEIPHNPEGPMLGSFPSLQKVVFAYAALSTGIGYYHFPSSTLGPPRQVEHGDDFLRSIPGLADNAINYRDVIRGITQDFHQPQIRKNLLASLQTVNSSVVSVELDSLTNPQRAIVGHRAGDKSIFELSLEQESDGFRRFYAHLLALYQTPRKLTLVFEEPENAIFPGALSLLADEFNAAPRDNRGQVILTTHNPTLLDRFDVDNIRVVEMRDGKTVVGKVSKEQRESVKSHLLTTGELLTVEKPKLDQASVSQQAA